jgi:hypothetical protein
LVESLEFLPYASFFLSLASMQTGIDITKVDHLKRPTQSSAIKWQKESVAGVSQNDWHELLN